MKRSKGPWKASGSAIWTNTPTTPFLVAEVTIPTSESNGIDWKANAQLIAAAPEMIELLTTMWAAIENGTVKEEFFELRESYRKVMAKCE